MVGATVSAVLLFLPGSAVSAMSSMAGSRQDARAQLYDGTEGNVLDPPILFCSILLAATPFKHRLTARAPKGNHQTALKQPITAATQNRPGQYSSTQCVAFCGCSHHCTACKNDTLAEWAQTVLRCDLMLPFCGIVVCAPCITSAHGVHIAGVLPSPLFSSQS